jgi:electron transfer flavoprotein alpha subunit
MSVLVIAELSRGSYKKASLEAISYGNRVAEQTQGTTTVLAFGRAAEADLSKAGAFGASSIINIDQQALEKVDAAAYAALIGDFAEKTGCKVIVFSHDNLGRAVAPRVSARLRAGLVSGAISLPDTGNGFIVRKNVFSGKAFADIEITTPVKIITLLPNALAPISKEGIAKVEQFQDDSGKYAPLTSVSFSKTEKDGEIPLTEAEMVVSAGRGLKGPENWGMVEELASVIGAATACSRPVADIGWRPHHEHVGQTGTAIRPNLYIAIGISGAIQHLAGVNGSKVIVVINKDPEAPFFKAADYGIVGDAFEIVPKLTEAFKKLKLAQ